IQAVKDFILTSILPGEDPAALTPTTPLITGGILDSLATLELVSFLEERYGIELEAHVVDASWLGTLNDIAKLVQTKTAAKTA
ncbi:MAG: acyl carrier protein, partial [Gemmatimonadales bacterium]